MPIVVVAPLVERSLLKPEARLESSRRQMCIFCQLNKKRKRVPEWTNFLLQFMTHIFFV